MSASYLASMMWANGLTTLIIGLGTTMTEFVSLGYDRIKVYGPRGKMF